LKFVVLDEYASMRSTVWDEVIRPAMADVPDSKAIFIGTPAGFNHFKVLYERGEGGDPDFKSFRFRTLDNPYVPKKEVDEIKLKTNPTVFRQEYEASFEQMAGSVYPMFRRETHSCKARGIDEDWDRIVGLDWGSRNPTAIVFAAVNPTGQILVYDFWTQGGLTVSQWADKLKNREDFEQINAWVIDPSALAQAREFGQYGIYFTSYNPETLKKLNDVTIGINLVSQYFLEGKIKIFDHCDVLIQQLEQYQWEPSQSRFGSDSRPKPLKKDDHGPDALRYLVSARPTGHKTPEKKYKGLDGASEMFWRAHNNELPKAVEDLMPRDPLMSGIDDEFCSLGIEDIWT